MQNARSPIGVLDSGLGGLSVLKALRDELPYEQFVYCADCAHAPWGEKSEEYIVERTRTIVHFLLEQKVKAVVLACNTATAAAADTLRQELSIPIIGIEPAVKPAAAKSRTGVIGVLATRRTVESYRYRALLERFASGSRVISVAASGLMECVERGDFTGKATIDLLKHYLKPIQAAGADKLVLGCTHYPFLSESIRAILGSNVELLEPGKPVALVTRKRLADLNLLNPVSTNTNQCLYYVSGSSEHADTLVQLQSDAKYINELPV